MKNNCEGRLVQQEKAVIMGKLDVKNKLRNAWMYVHTFLEMYRFDYMQGISGLDMATEYFTQE